ncbi:MAG TPA: sulfotransferase domain-containing protein, partial [Geminicoccaceae bacterium]|nr:sulfotransferase domain-containing protein [Geminicoccaceae bacterium]
MVRYEDLRLAPAKTLRQITALMGETFRDEEIEEAIGFGSFDNLRALESRGFFRQGGLSLRNPSDPESFKVRRAKVGGYRDYFSAEQTAELEQLVAERLSPVFGYTAAKATDRHPERIAV